MLHVSALLVALLALSELPSPFAQRRPPWRGQCDRDTRMLDYDADAPLSFARIMFMADDTGRRCARIPVSGKVVRCPQVNDTTGCQRAPWIAVGGNALQRIRGPLAEAQGHVCF
jgi:hypothetical protein